MKGKRVLILGGMGYMGLNLAQALTPDNTVTIADLGIDRRRLEAVGLLGEMGTRTLNITDVWNVHRTVTGFDVIFALAGRSGASSSFIHPRTDLEVNCQGHLNILEACRVVNPNAVIIFPSSRLVYGTTETLPVDEDAPANPQSLYAIHKFVGEMYYRLYHRTFGLKTVVLRISNPVGPGQFRIGSYGIYNYFIYQAVEGIPIQIYGDGQQCRDLVSIGDVVRAFIQASTCPEAYGHTFNIGSGEGMMLVDYVRQVTTLAGCGTVTHVDWPSSTGIYSGDFIANIDKAYRVLNWQPITPLEVTITATIDFYRGTDANLLHVI